MIRHTEKRSRSASYLVLSLLTFTCLVLSAFAASGANAFTQTITDIEDPAVKAKVLGLDVEATRGFHVEQVYHGEYGPMLMATIDWSHSLAGKIDNSLTDGQLPKITVQRNPTIVSITGKVVTEKAEGEVEYRNLEYCLGGRTTTKSPLLDVSLGGFYQSGTSSSSGNPEVSLKTGNLDPWVQTCPYEDLPPEATHIQTFRSPTAADLTYSGEGGATNLNPRWSPVDGGLTTTEDGCTPEFCDFTIRGHNSNTAAPSYNGTATSTFVLRLRLEYPAEPVPAPNTKITKGPRKLIKTKSGKAKIAIRFRSTGAKGTKFKCRLDKGPFSSCSSPFKRKVRPKRHRFAVVSVYQGKVDKSPAVYKWTVKKVKKKPKKKHT